IESTVEIRLYDHKTSRAFYKNLTITEFMQIASILKGIEWE
ncbi:30S ribosomal protein S23, partial [Clostridium botulinum]|nr:30S ribosomal protein S23 [Clostridium botulinum]